MSAMLKFAPNGTYVMCKYQHHTSHELYSWAREMKIPQPLEPSKLHSTVVQSNQTIDNWHDLNREICEWEFSPVRFEIFDTRFKSLSGKPEGALVLIIEAPELEELHKDLITNRNAVHTRSNYTPHLALSYFFPRDIDPQSLTLPAFPLKAERIVSEPIDVDWLNH